MTQVDNSETFLPASETPRVSDSLSPPPDSPLAPAAQDTPATLEIPLWFQSFVEAQAHQQRALQETVQRLTERLAQSRPPSPPSPREDSVIPSVEKPARYRSREHVPEKWKDAKDLSDGQDPTLNGWEIDIRSIFHKAPRSFPNERIRMDYMFQCTSGTARQALEPRIKASSLDPFQSIEEVFETLFDILGNPNELEDAKKTYRDCFHQSGETYAEFRVRFLLAAEKAQVRLPQRREDLPFRISAELRRHIAVIKADLPTFRDLSDRLVQLDVELRLIATEELEKRSKRLYKAPERPLSSSNPRQVNGQYSKPVGDSPRISIPSEEALRASSQRPSNATDSRDWTKIQCYNCHEYGHGVRACPQPRRTDLKSIDINEMSEPEPISAFSDSGNEEA